MKIEENKQNDEIISFKEIGNKNENVYRKPRLGT